MLINGPVQPIASKRVDGEPAWEGLPRTPHTICSPRFVDKCLYTESDNDTRHTSAHDSWPCPVFLVRNGTHTRSSRLGFRRGLGSPQRPQLQHHFPRPGISGSVIANHGTARECRTTKHKAILLARHLPRRQTMGFSLIEHQRRRIPLGRPANKTRAACLLRPRR